MHYIGFSDHNMCMLLSHRWILSPFEQPALASWSHLLACGLILDEVSRQLDKISTAGTSADWGTMQVTMALCTG